MKRTLVISNACFSSSISNGRTLEGLFGAAERENLAQFFVYGCPDSTICDNYYQVTDSNALRSLFTKKRVGQRVRRQMEPEGNSGGGRVGIKKTPMKVLLRELVWLLGKWNNSELLEWVDEFQPEVICLFVANNTFLNRMAINIAKRYSIPVVVYSTEAYCFMEFNYLTNRPSVVYRIYYSWLRWSYNRLSKYVKSGFFNSTLLRELYANAFSFPCYCIMNGSRIDFRENYKLDSQRPIKVSYLGNLGLNRHKALIELAQELCAMDKKYHLDVYGVAPNAEVEVELRQCSAISFHGFVPYDKVIDIIHESSLLIHVEWNDEILNRDLKYAFSTKIADSVCSGTPLLVYANRDLAEVVFLEENKCAFLADNRDALRNVLNQALNSEACRKDIVENAKNVSLRFFAGNDSFMKAFE